MMMIKLIFDLISWIAFYEELLTKCANKAANKFDGAQLALARAAQDR